MLDGTETSANKVHHERCVIEGLRPPGAEVMSQVLDAAADHKRHEVTVIALATTGDPNETTPRSDVRQHCSMTAAHTGAVVTREDSPVR